MDFIYLISFTVFWGAVFGLALGCEHLQRHQVTP